MANVGSRVTDGGGSGGSSNGATRGSSLLYSAEPSPTTSSFFKPSFMEGSGENAALSLKKKWISNNNVDEIASSIFGFKFYSGSTCASGLASLMISTGLNQNEHVNEIQDQRFSQSPARSTTLDTSPHDAYNRKKYGQKLVEGSEFACSYYKCNPDCEVKKIFEHSPSGQRTEIVYKGSHDHPKPQSAHRPTLMSIQDEKMDKDLSFTARDALSPRQANEGGHDGSNSQTWGLNDENYEDGLFSKRRKTEDGLDFTPVVQPIREPRVVVQTTSDVDILEDGYRWRKYGQKVVRGNPNPRSYYKCTNAGCPVRKHVERASHDFKAVITTYESKHNHDVPLAKNSNNHKSSGTASCNTGNTNTRPEHSSSISLSLGGGISRFESGISGLNLYVSRDPSNRRPSNLGRILMGP